jgi:hypothetical protein
MAFEWCSAVEGGRLLAIDGNEMLLGGTKHVPHVRQIDKLSA